MQSTLNISKARSLAEDTLSPARLNHVFGVAESVAELCRIYELDEVQSDLTCAALLHDITKEKPLEAQLHLCKEYGIILRTDDLSCPKMLHSCTAAVFAAREFQLADEFCDAIRYHTTGRAGMSLYEKLLFLADYIEKNRTWPGCKAVRRYFRRAIKTAKSREEKLHALDRTVLFGLNTTLSELIEADRFIHRDTVDARNDLLREKSRLKKDIQF